MLPRYQVLCPVCGVTIDIEMGHACQKCSKCNRTIKKGEDSFRSGEHSWSHYWCPQDDSPKH
jgi:hypothetical protein